MLVCCKWVDGFFFFATGSDLQCSLSLLLKRVLLICVSHAFAVSELAALSRTGISVIENYYFTQP